MVASSILPIAASHSTLSHAMAISEQRRMICALRFAQVVRATKISYDLVVDIPEPTSPRRVAGGDDVQALAIGHDALRSRRAYAALGSGCGQLPTLQFDCG